MKTINRKSIAIGTGLLSAVAIFATTSSAFAAPDPQMSKESREVKAAYRRYQRETRDVAQARTPVERARQRQEQRAALNDFRREERELVLAKRDWQRRQNNAVAQRRKAAGPPYGNAYGYHRNRTTRPVYNRPIARPNYANGQRIEFPGVVLNNVNGGTTFSVRGDNGITYRVRTRSGVRLNRGQRVRISGDWYNGTVINSGVNFI